MKILTVSSFETRFHPPQIHKKSQQQKNTTLTNKHSRLRGVAKIVFDVPMLHGTRFFFWLPCSVGTRFLTFATPPTRERLFFHFFHTSPAKSSKTTKTASWSHAVDVSARKMQNANRHKNPSLPRRIRSGRIFYISKNSIIQFIIVNISQGISTIQRLTRICFQMKNERKSWYVLILCWFLNCFPYYEISCFSTCLNYMLA